MAEVKSSVDSNRANIADVVPLNSPLSMYIEPTKICNFKCFYCMHSTRDEKDSELEKNGFNVANMDMDFYKKLVKDIMEFPSQPKRVCFSGLGEPLANKRLPEMIKLLRDSGFEGRIDVISNGSLLTPQLSDALIEAGLSRIQISVQGLDNATYKEVCGIDYDLEKLKENIKYFYENKKNSSIYVKIIDSILKGKEDEEKFFGMFKDICDTIFIEHLVVMQQQMGDHNGKVDGTRNLMGEYVEPRKVCAVMFYFLQVTIDGETYPCSTPGLLKSLSMGNANDKSLLEIWNDKKRNALIRTNLKDGYKVIPACSECSSCIAIADDSEYMDDRAEEVLEKFPPKN